MSSPASWWCRVAVTLGAASLLVHGILTTTWPWVVDDAFISLRYADRLVGGDGPTWTDGERVEGYSNLAWVLLTALLRAAGCNELWAVRGLGLLCMLGTLVVLARSRWLPGSLPALLAVPIVASTGITTTWTTAGLETPLLCFVLALGFEHVGRAMAEPSVRRHTWIAGAWLAVAVTTRPDSPLWVACLVVALAMFAAAPTIAGRGRVALQLALLPVVAMLAQTLFRLAYYGDWLPNTAYAKITPGSASSTAGIHYLLANCTLLWGLLAPALLGLVGLFAARSRPAVATAAASLALWTAYVVHVGGDAFPRGRMLMPALVPLTILAAHGLHAMLSCGRFGRVLATAAALACAIVTVREASADHGDPRLELSKWEWQGKASGEWLGRAFRAERPLLAVDAAGAVPYYSALPCLDMLGLCDRTIARTPLPVGETFVTAHARGNGPYVLSRRPDLVMFGTPPGAPLPMWFGGRQLEADPTFLRDYRVVQFDLGTPLLEDGTQPPLRIFVWARVEGRLGLRSADGDDRRRLLPAFWLGSHRQPYSFREVAAGRLSIDPAIVQRDLQAGAAKMLAPGVLGVTIANRTGVVAEFQVAGRHVASALPFAPGRHRLTAPGLPAGVRLALAHVDGLELPQDNGAFVVPGTAPTTVDVVCTVPPGIALPFWIDHLVLERED